MSSKKQLDALGERMKHFEKIETSDKFIPNLPIYVRLDGRGFSKFTKGMARPYDERMSNLMLATSQYLLKEFNASLSYVQSDEISLIIHNTYESPCTFDGKKQKLCSTLAASASAFFSLNYFKYFQEELDLNKRLPTFDCRLFNLPSWDEAANAILWRYLDAKKNSVQMLAQSVFSHKELQGLNESVVKDKLKTDKNIVWEDYPEFFKYGVLSKSQSFEISEGVIRNRVVSLELKQPFYLLSHSERLSLVL